MAGARSDVISANADLMELTLELAGSLDARTVIGRILGRGVHIAGADRATLSSISGDHLTIEATVGIGGLVTWVGREYPRAVMLQQAAVAEMLATGSTVLGGALTVDNAEPEFRDALDPVRHTAVLPIMEDGAVVGMLVLSRYQDVPFDPADTAVLSAFGALAGLALRNAKLYEEATAAARRSQAAAEAATEVASTEALPELLLKIIDHACEAGGANSAAIMRVENGFGVVEATSGTAPVGSRWPLDEATREAIDAGVVHVLEVAGQEGRDDDLQMHAAAYGHALVVPLQFAGELVGLLVLGRSRGRGSFAAGDVAALQQFAGLAALVLHNSRLVHRLREAEINKREFMNMVVHELRGPLTVIEGYAEMLGQDAERWDSDADEYLATIRRQADHARALAEDLLILARLETDDSGIAAQLLPVADVIAEAVERVRPAAHLRGGGIVLEAGPGLSALGDHTLVARIIENLLRNAVAYAGERPQVRICAAQTEAALQVRVIDDGPGIPTAEREQIFARFARGSRRGAGGGSGLGLHVSREGARRMGGDLVLESSGGADGTCFLLCLPAPAPA